MVIVAARGITGGISIGVTYFVTAPGSSVPPGIWAMARSIQPVCVATYQAIVVAPVSLRKLRRVGMVPPPVGTAVGCRESRSPSRRAKGPGSGITDPRLGTRAAGILPTTRPRAPRGSSRRRRRQGAAPCECANRRAGQQRGARAFLGLAPLSPNRAARGHRRHQTCHLTFPGGLRPPAGTLHQLTPAIDAAGCGGQGQSTPIGRARPPYLSSTSWLRPAALGT